MQRGLHLVFIVSLIAVAGCEHVGVFEPLREVQCVGRANISLKEAITAAESGGGRALDADYREDEELGCLEGNLGVYDVTLLTDGRISVVSVDAGSGQVGPRQPEPIMNALLAEGRRFEGSPVDMAMMAPGLSLGISEAIDVAISQGGTALSAWIEANDGNPGYTVKVVENGRVRVTWVDGAQSARS